MAKSKKKKKNTTINFNLPEIPELLKQILPMSQPQLKLFCFHELEKNGYLPHAEDGYVYAEGNIPVMLVAHLDTVHKKPVTEFYVSNLGNITSPQGIGGDDRCGVYTILNLIESTQLRPYVLFAEDEEIGCVGSSYFSYVADAYDINVNFIIEIDRKGNNDAVYYDCDNPEFEEFISSYGFETAYGSFTDICQIAPVIGAAAVNLSSGYYNAHTTDEIINIHDLNNIFERVVCICTDVVQGKTKPYEYIEKIYKYKVSKYYGWYTDDIYDYEDYRQDFGNVNNTKGEQVYDKKTMKNTKTITASPIYFSEGNYLKINGMFYDEYSIDENEWEYFIGNDGRVYLYYWEIDGLVLVRNAEAFTLNGFPMTVDELYADEWQVYEI